MKGGRLFRSQSAKVQLARKDSVNKHNIYDRSVSADNIPRTINFGFVEGPMTTFEEKRAKLKEIDAYMMFKRRNTHCSYGLLFECVDERGPYPLVTYHVYRAPRGYLSGRYVSHPEHLDDRSADISIMDGLYMELFPTGEIRQLGIGPDRTVQVYDKNSVFVLSAFRADPHNDFLHQNWYTWSGASSFVGHLPHSLQVKAMWFYKRQPGSTTDLTYILICEVHCEPHRFLHLRQFVDGMQHRQCGFIDLFRLRLAV